MQQLKALPPVELTTCPAWCVDRDHDQDFDAVAGIRFEHHHSAGEHITVLPPDGSTNVARVRNLLVRIEQLTNDPVDTGYIGVLVRSVEDELELSLRDATALGLALLKAVTLAISERPESDVGGLERAGWGRCTRCNDAFELDSSPSFENCWSCAEIVDAELAR